MRLCQLFSSGDKKSSEPLLRNTPHPISEKCRSDLIARANTMLARLHEIEIKNLINKNESEKNFLKRVLANQIGVLNNCVDALKDSTPEKLDKLKESHKTAHTSADGIQYQHTCFERLGLKGCREASDVVDLLYSVIHALGTPEKQAEPAVSVLHV